MKNWLIDQVALRFPSILKKKRPSWELPPALSIFFRNGEASRFGVLVQLTNTATSSQGGKTVKKTLDMLKIKKNGQNVLGWNTKWNKSPPKCVIEVEFGENFDRFWNPEGWQFGTSESCPRICVGWDTSNQRPYNCCRSRVLATFSIFCVGFALSEKNPWDQGNPNPIQMNKSKEEGRNKKKIRKIKEHVVYEVFLKIYVWFSERSLARLVSPRYCRVSFCSHLNGMLFGGFFVSSMVWRNRTFWMTTWTLNKHECKFWRDLIYYPQTNEPPSKKKEPPTPTKTETRQQLSLKKIN